MDSVVKYHCCGSECRVYWVGGQVRVFEICGIL
jgi:hypothetical protein